MRNTSARVTSHSRSVWLVVLLIFSTLVAACSSPATAPATSSQPSPAASRPAALDPPLSPTVKVKSGTLGLSSDGPVYIAIEKGFFTEQGLEVEDVRFDAGARLVPALASSQIDAGAGAPSAGLFNAMKRDIPIEIVGDKSRAGVTSSTIGVLVRKDLLDDGSIKTPADLKGRKVAMIAADSSNVIQLDRMMRTVGMTYKDVEVVVMAAGDIVSALVNRSIDVGIVAEPIPTRAVATGSIVRWKMVSEFYPDQQSSVLMYSPTFGKEKPEAARRFMVAYVKGMRAYYEAFFKNLNRAEIIPIMTKHTSLKDAKLYDTIEPAAGDPDGRVNVKSLTDDLEWLVREGLVKEKPDLSVHVNLSYNDYALSKLGMYPR